MNHKGQETLGELESRSGYMPAEMSQWFKADIATPRAVVLLVHGLNQKPSKWQALIDFFNRLGIHVFRLTLQGHGGASFKDMKTVDEERWLFNLRAGYWELEQHYPGVRKIVAAYSLGGLVSQALQLDEGRALFSGQILLAPSLSLHPYVHLVRPLTHIFEAIPSRTPKAYRANPHSTSSAAYRALFRLVRRFNRADDHFPVNLPSLVLIHRDDEVVSYRGIRHVKEKFGLDNWQIKAVKNHRSRLNTDFKHMIIDPPSLGPEGWAFVIKAMEGFINTL